MKNLFTSLMIMIVGFLTAFFHFNSSAFSNTVEKLPFKILKDNENFYYKVNTLKKNENLIIDKIDIFDEQYSKESISDEEIFSYTNQKQNKKRYLRATIESSVLFGLVSAYYWGTRTAAADFHYDVSFNTLKKKFSGEAILFDEDPIGTNSFPGHSLAGSYYYLIARNNNLSRIESFLWSFALSSIHEFFIEFQEVASINDFMTTPVAGPAIGEVMYQFGRYFRCSENKNTPGYKIMAAIMDPIALVNSWIWDDVHYSFTDAETCHYTSIQNEFSIFNGVSVGYHENINRFNIGVILGFYGKLYLIPHYGEVSDIREFFYDTVLTEMVLEAIVTDKRVDNVRFFAKTVWAAYHRQTITRDSQGNATGYSFFVGLASAFEHTQYRTDEFEDWIGAVHVLGPSMELTFFHKKGYSRIGLDIFGDFAMVRSFAFDKYKKTHSLDGIKSILREENYYYAYGVNINPRIDIKYGSYRLFISYKYAHYDSFEGRERIKASNDFHLTDKKEEYGFTLGRHIDFFHSTFFKRHQIWLETEVRRIARSGFIADSKVTHDGGNTWLLLRFKMTF
jgi:Domain of unknown function (DUF3943)